MRRLFWPMLFAAALAFAACGGGGGGDGTIEPVVPVVEVSLFGDRFTPDDLTVTIGTTVRWVNDDEEEHTVTSGIDNSDPDAGLVFDSPILEPGDAFEVDFDEPGDLDYFCRFHVDFGMVGFLSVVP